MRESVCQGKTKTEKGEEEICTNESAQVEQKYKWKMQVEQKYKRKMQVEQKY